jgi:hypothetical protein
MSFEKLNDTNYYNWSFKIQKLLEELDLWDIATGKEK